jgi:putative membrane protein
MLADLRERRGRPFDRVYLDQQVSAHRDALMVMSAYAEGGANPVLRQAAATTAPLVRRHLDMAIDLQQRLGR